MCSGFPHVVSRVAVVVECRPQSRVIKPKPKPKQCGCARPPPSFSPVQLFAKQVRTQRSSRPSLGLTSSLVREVRTLCARRVRVTRAPCGTWSAARMSGVNGSRVVWCACALPSDRFSRKRRSLSRQRNFRACMARRPSGAHVRHAQHGTPCTSLVRGGCVTCVRFWCCEIRSQALLLSSTHVC